MQEKTACKKLTLLNKHYGTTLSSFNLFKVHTRRQTVPEEVVQEGKSADRWRICFLQGQSPRSVIQHQMINPQLLCIGTSYTVETQEDAQARAGVYVYACAYVRDKDKDRKRQTDR